MAHRLAPASCLRQPSAAHPCAACAIPPHYRVFRCVEGVASFLARLPCVPAIVSTLPALVEWGLPRCLCRCWTEASGQAPLYESPGPEDSLSPDRSHAPTAARGRRALGVWRKQARDGLRSLVGAMDGGAERCARPPGHDGPRRSRRSCFKPDRHDGPRRSRRSCFKPDRHGGPRRSRRSCPGRTGTTASSGAELFALNRAEYTAAASRASQAARSSQRSDPCLLPAIARRTFYNGVAKTVISSRSW